MKNHASPKPLLLISLLLLPLLKPLLVWAEVQALPLAKIIAALKAQGHSIIYSNSVVASDIELQVDHLNLNTLREALQTRGLTLEAQAGVWVIQRAGELQQERGEDITPSSVAELPVLETVIVTGSVHRFPVDTAASSLHSFGSYEMSQIPALGSDAMRMALRLPGMSSVGISAKPQIRGGLSDELLVIQDGVELLEPFHLADYHSPFSSIDYRTIESMDVYTGGFPSRYGNRMSGVMDIQNNWQDAEYDTDIGISSFANFIHTRGSVAQEQSTQWLLSVRQGDLTKLSDYIETESGDPTYLDASARVNAAISDDVRLSAGVVYAEDDIVFSGVPERASSNIETAYVWARLETQLSPTLRNQFTASWLDFQRVKKLDSVEPEGKGGFLDHRQTIQRLALRNDWSALHKQAHWEFGWQAEYNQADYEHVSSFDRGILSDILSNERVVERNTSLQPSGWSGGMYLQGEWRPWESLVVQPSLRWDMQNYYLQQEAQYQLSPRFGAEFTVSQDISARVSIGRYNQPEGIHELQLLDGVNRYFKPQHSDQAVAGFEWSKGAFDFVFEYYYKRYNNQKTRFENTFNPFVLLPELEPDRVALSPSRARAKGLDVDLSWRFDENLSWQFRYSHMNAQDRLLGHWVDRRWSQRNTFNFAMVLERGPFTLSTAANWHSGWRTTTLPELVEAGTEIPIEAVLNNSKQREYFSLDVSASKNWKIGDTRLQAYIDVSNLTDRNNQAGVDFDVSEVEGSYLLIRDRETLLGRVTSMGLTLSF